MSGKMNVGLELEEEHVWLRVEDLGECCFELWETDNGAKSSLVKVKIPIKNWKDLIKKWNSRKKEER